MSKCLTGTKSIVSNMMISNSIRKTIISMIHTDRYICNPYPLKALPLYFQCKQSRSAVLAYILHELLRWLSWQWLRTETLSILKRHSTVYDRKKSTKKCCPLLHHGKSVRTFKTSMPEGFASSWRLLLCKYPSLERKAI